MNKYVLWAIYNIALIPVNFWYPGRDYYFVYSIKHGVIVYGTASWLK